MKISNRIVNFGIFGFAVAAILIAYFFFQIYLELDPCPLCVTHCLFIVLAGAVALVAAVHNPSGRGQQFYNAATAVVALAGAAVSGRQLWLQSLAEDQVPACGPTLGFMYDNFPFKDLLSALFLGEGSCADVKWQFLGVSIPGWTLITFVVIVIPCIWMMLRGRAAARHFQAPSR